MALRFSVALPRLVEPDVVQPYRQMFALARQIGKLGFDTAYLGHYSFTPETGDASAPFVLLGAIAAQTERLRLGTAIYLAGLHHPVSVIEQVNQLDQISGGRAVVGLGKGYRPYEYEGYGVDYCLRGALLTEMIEVIRRSWTTGRVTHSGELFDIPDLPVEPPCVQSPHPPILVGGTSRAALDRAASVGDGWISLPFETLGHTRRLVERYRKACEQSGREPYVCLMREAWIAPSTAEVERNWMGRALKFHRRYWAAGMRGDRDDPVLQRVASGKDVGYQKFAHDRAIAGTPDECIEAVRRWHEAIDFDERCLILVGPRDPGTLRRTVDLFADEVMPAFV